MFLTVSLAVAAIFMLVVGYVSIEDAIRHPSRG